MSKGHFLLLIMHCLLEDNTIRNTPKTSAFVHDAVAGKIPALQ